MVSVVKVDVVEPFTTSTTGCSCRALFIWISRALMGCPWGTSLPVDGGTGRFLIYFSATYVHLSVQKLVKFPSSITSTSCTGAAKKLTIGWSIRVWSFWRIPLLRSWSLWLFYSFIMFNFSLNYCSSVNKHNNSANTATTWTMLNKKIPQTMVQNV